jgi:hypothetical protein
MQRAFSGSRQEHGNESLFVMAGLVPAIHVFLAWGSKDVDARHKAGHDEFRYISGLARRTTLS